MCLFNKPNYQKRAFSDSVKRREEWPVFLKSLTGRCAFCWSCFVTWRLCLPMHARYFFLVSFLIFIKAHGMADDAPAGTRTTRCRL